MTNLQSDKVIHCNTEKIYNFLIDFNNFEKLMPEQIINWQSTPDNCSFTIQGMADLGMKIINRNPYSHILIQSEGDVPFDFELECNLSKINEEDTLSQLIFKAKLNPMLQMVAKTPLQNFVNILSEKLKEICESPGFMENH